MPFKEIVCPTMMAMSASASLRELPLLSSSSANSRGRGGGRQPNRGQQQQGDDGDDAEHDFQSNDNNDCCGDSGDGILEIIHDDTDDKDEAIRGWDHSILLDNSQDLLLTSSHSSSASPSSPGRGKFGETVVHGRSLLSDHALAIGNVVMGSTSNACSKHEEQTLEHHQEDNNDHTNNNYWWQTSINSHIHALATNNHGSVIAVATSHEVSILKGHDGSVLATRQICSSSPSMTTTKNVFRLQPQLIFLSDYCDGSTTVTTTATASTREIIIGDKTANKSGDTARDDEKDSLNVKEKDEFDALLILCPEDKAMDNYNQQQQQASPLLFNNIILISNISGTLLNSSDIRLVTEGAKMMKITALKLLDRNEFSNGVEGVVITGVQGAFVRPDTIRFFVEYRTTTTTTHSICSSANPNNNSHNIMTVVDYNTVEKKTCLVLQDLGKHYLMNEDRNWHQAPSTSSFVKMDGMGMDSYHPMSSGSFLLANITVPTTTPTTTTSTAAMIAPSSTTTTLLWINILDLSIAAKLTFPSNVVFPLLSCTPLRSWDSKTCVSAAVAYRRKRTESREDGASHDSATKPEIIVVQAVLIPRNEVDKDNTSATTTPKDVVPDAMILFTLNVDTPNNSYCSSVDLSSVSSSIVGRNTCNINDNKEGAYVFRYLCKSNKCRGNDRGGNSDAATTKLWEFVPNKYSQLGQVQTLIVCHDFDRVRSLLDQLGDCDECLSGCRISTPITKSFISLIQLQHILSKPLSKEENVLEAKDCLKLISKSVILSGGDVKEVKCMCDAAKFLMSWPKNQVRYVDVGKEVEKGTGRDVVTMVFVQDVCMALSTVSSAISSVVNVVGSSKSALLEDHRRKLDERIATLKSLITIVPSLEATKVTADDPFLAIETTVGLLHALVSQGAFKLVKRLQNSECGKIALSYHPDAIASSALRIPKSVNPCTFIPWLCDDVFPGLAIGHALLRQIRSFICRLADYYDDQNVAGGLDSSILLLSVRKLLSCMHEPVPREIQLILLSFPRL